ncbi:MAG: hypothetical protein JW863_14405 [Chitinispirillaceae bacterium]|nr:hypothetical protein [Chitinispirillaceae bacterium]
MNHPNHLKTAVSLLFLSSYLLFGVASVTAQDLVAHWSFDDYDSENNTYTDVTGNGYDAVTGSITLGGGVVGEAADCNDTTDAITVDLEKGTLNYPEFTIEALIYCDVNPVNPGSFYNYLTILNCSRVGLEGSGYTGGFCFQLTDAGKLQLGIAQPTMGAWNTCVSETVFKAETWYHVAVTYDGTTIRLYINGASDGETSTTGEYLAQTEYPVSIGCQVQVTDPETKTTRYRNWFKGKIDELKVFDYALSQGTLVEHATEYGIEVKPAPQLFAHWSFDKYDTENRTYTDVTGNGYHAETDELAFTEGVLGNALDLSDPSINISIPTSVGDFSVEKFTIEGLIYSNVDPVSNTGTWDGYKVLFSYHRIGPSESGITGGYTLEITDGGSLVMGMSEPTQGAWQLCEDDQVLQAKRWYHVTGTYDGATMKLYIDGVLVQQTAAPDGYLGQALIPARIGSQFQVSDTVEKTGTVRCHFDGKIDELKLYNYALDAATVTSHFEEYDIPEPPEPEPQLVAWWSFDSTDEQSVYYDMTGNGYDAEGSAVVLGRGVRGTALDCSGETAEIEIPVSTGKFMFDAYTIEGWIYSNIDLENPGSFYNFKGIYDNARVGMEASGVTGGYNLQISDKGFVHAGMSVPQGGSWYKCEGTTLLQPRKWYHVASTYGDGKLRVFLNGKLEGETDIPAGYLPSDAVPARIASQYQLTDYEDNTGRYRHQFDGKIDELKLYNYTLDGETILEHYNDLKPEEEPSFEINIGMRTTFAQPGDTVVMPVYIANHEEYRISALQLVMAYDPDQLKLLSATEDSGLVARWELFDWNDADAGSVPLAMAGTSVALSYGEGELFRAVFVVSDNVKTDETCTIELKEVSIDEQNNLVVSTTQNGKIIIADKSILYGDVTGNGEVNVVDAQTVLKYVVGAVSLPDEECCPNFTVAVADVSANGTITSYDAALIFQYSLGLIPEFPVESATAASAPRFLAKTASGEEHLAKLSFRQVSSGDNEQVFDLVGSELYGFYAGEFAIACKNGEDFLSKSVISTNVKGATLSSRYLPDDNLLKVAVSSNDDIDDDEPVTIVRITLPPAGNDDPPEFSVETALINEGKILTEYENRQLTALVGQTVVTIRPVLTQVRVVNRKLVVRRGNGGIPAVVTVSDLRGRTVAKFMINGTKGEFNLNRLGNGMYLYRLRDAQNNLTGQLTLIGR